MTPKNWIGRIGLLATAALLSSGVWANTDMQDTLRFPANRSADVNPDTHLVLTFGSAPILGKSGKIRIYDAADNSLVDSLDLSIPPGPTVAAPASAMPVTQIAPYDYATPRATNANTVAGAPSGTALVHSARMQLTIIGGFSEGFHFYPVIIHGKVATIYLHNNLLAYGKTYYVQIDPGVLTVAGKRFAGFRGKQGWIFSTKKAGPAADVVRLVVAADGSGDFNTVQGAVDYIPDNSSRRVTVFIKNGTYEEIVYFRNKSNLTFLGEDRAKTIVTYVNDEVFNPHPANVGTNEMPGTFPYRRGAFMADNVTAIELVNFSIVNPPARQNEGLLLMGERNIVSNMNITGGGDALQVNGPTYFTECLVTGRADTVLGRGPTFFNHCELRSHGTFMWIRNTAANHGNVFLNSTFQTLDNDMTEIARAPINRGKAYPYAEAVLINCLLGGVSPAGWGLMSGDTANMHFWEYNSRNASDGKLADVSARNPDSRQLSMEKDAQIIANYSDPAYVLGGWRPAMAPLLLRQPAAVAVSAGQTVQLDAKFAAVPIPAYQWSKNGVAIPGATAATLTLQHVDAGDAANYTVTATNATGSVTSDPGALTVH